ncbi:hypothetical protein TSMEX_010741 [Taenia solium]|eukprot:TsM_000280400 transcript=TsM_000280400 gene=TsM_000280400
MVFFSSPFFSLSLPPLSRYLSLWLSGSLLTHSFWSSSLEEAVDYSCML